MAAKDYSQLVNLPRKSEPPYAKEVLRRSKEHPSLESLKSMVFRPSRQTRIHPLSHQELPPLFDSRLLLGVPRNTESLITPIKMFSDPKRKMPLKASFSGVLMKTPVQSNYSARSPSIGIISESNRKKKRDHSLGSDNQMQRLRNSAVNKAVREDEVENMYSSQREEQGIGSARWKYMARVHTGSAPRYFLECFSPEHWRHKELLSWLDKSLKDLRNLADDHIPGNLKLNYFPNSLRRKKYILMLDLDETLVHCCNFNPVEAKNAMFNVSYLNPNGIRINAKFNMRPFLKEFLEEVSSFYDIGIYTASEKSYAEAIVKFFDPLGRYVKHLLHRDYCLMTNKGYLVKDLRAVVPKEELDKIILVDNSIHCFLPQLSRGVPILNFIADPRDRELLQLKDFLLSLATEHTKFSFVLDHHFGLKRISQYTSSDHVIKELQR